MLSPLTTIIIADEDLDIETDGRKAGCCETRGPGLGLQLIIRGAGPTLH